MPAVPTVRLSPTLAMPTTVAMSTVAMSTTELASTAAAVVVGVVFLVAGVTKLARPAQWRSESAGMGVPSWLAPVVPFGEVILGALLVVGVERDVVAWLAVAVLVAFTAAIVWQLAHGRRPPCACFGSLSPKPLGAGQLVRNAILIALALVAALA